MEDRIKYLEILKYECRDIYEDSDLIPFIRDEINKEINLYYEFIKSGPRIFYSTSNSEICSSSIDKILKIAQENNLDSSNFIIRRHYIDPKEYEYIIEGNYDMTGKLLWLDNDPYEEYFEYFDFKNQINLQNRLRHWRQRLTINHFFNPGDAVFNINTRETGIVKENFKTDLKVLINNTEKSENTENTGFWFIPYVEYDIGG